MLVLLLELSVLPIGGRWGETAAGHGRQAAVLAVGRYGTVADSLDLLVKPREVTRYSSASEARPPRARARGLADPGTIPDGGRGEVGALRHRRHFAAPTTVLHRGAGPAADDVLRDGGSHAAVAFGAVGPVAVPAQVAAGVGHPIVAEGSEVRWATHSGSGSTAGAADAHLLYASVDLSEVVGGRNGE